MTDKNIKTGTTTIGLTYEGGVIFAADKRASMGYLIAHKNVDKVIQITKDILMTIAGGVADAQALAKYLKAESKLYELRNDKKITVKALGSLLQTILYSGRGGYFPYQVQLLLGGGSDGDFSLLSFDSGGSSLSDKYVSTGSGSPFAYGVLEEGYVEKMNEKDAINLAVKAVRSAIRRDMASGEGIDVWIVNAKGVTKLPKVELSKIL